MKHMIVLSSSYSTFERIGYYIALDENFDTKYNLFKEKAKENCEKLFQTYNDSSFKRKIEQTNVILYPLNASKIQYVWYIKNKSSLKNIKKWINITEIIPYTPKYEDIFKKYNPQKQTFIFEAYNTINDENIYKEFAHLDDFANYVNYDFENAYFLDYEFTDEELEKYNVKKSILSSTVMDKLGIYDDYLEKYIYFNEKPLLNKDQEYAISTQDFLPLNIEVGERGETNFFYISDLHLDYKLYKKFMNKKVNIYELNSFFDQIIENLKKTYFEAHWLEKNNIIFDGDICSNFKILFMFFHKISLEFSENSNIFFILGNHELWFKNINGYNLQNIIELYKKELLKLEIIVLENDLFLPVKYKEKNIYSYKELLNLNASDFEEMFLYQPYGIYGALGFAGKNKIFNYENGIYRDAPIDRIKEIEQSDLVEKMHDFLTIKMPKTKKLIFVTHNPKTDWSDNIRKDNWFYINGHTHKNSVIFEKDEKILEDNQIGYYSNSYGFKNFSLKNNINIFEYYQDGIYEINREQYINFYRHQNKGIKFNREYKKIFMIKKANTYCFMAENNKKELLLLNGGVVKKVPKLSLQYIYDNLENYSKSVSIFLNDYHQFLKEISKFIKSIGGDGTIHGCIVDIDFFNHLYINPVDGKITPYFASTIVEKYIYKNLPSLLKNKCKDLYINFVNEQNKIEKTNILYNLCCQEQISNETIYYNSTDIYKISRIIKNLQYVLDSNIVRLWNDDFFKGSNTNNGKMIISYFLDEAKTNE